MKISKGTVKNINKKLIASILAVSLTTPLIGCEGEQWSSIGYVNYVIDENGYINGIDGTVQYWNLFDCSFVKVYNNITDENYYTISLRDVTDVHYDIFTRQNLEDSEAFEVEYFGSIYTWLNALGTTKDAYSEEELRELLNIFIEKQEKDKQLVKE